MERRLQGTGGIPASQVGGGTLSRRTLNVGMPILVGGPEAVEVQPTVPGKCPVTTRSGNACKAKPTASGLCVGHERAAQAKGA